MSLKNNAISGIIWTFIDTVLLKGGVFVTTLFLARILGPAEFGLIGMVTVFITLGTVIVDSGLQTSLLRSTKVDDNDFTTVFFINLILSLVVYLILFLFAPIIADFFNQKPLIKIRRKN